MDEANKIRVVVVDDHDLMRNGICSLIEQDARLVVAGDFAYVKKLPSKIFARKPDIILLDLDDEHDIFELVSNLRQINSRVPILFLTSEEHSPLSEKAIVAGAQGLITKDKDPDFLQLAIVRAYQGEVWLTRSMMASVIDSLRQAGEHTSPEEARIATLTPQEREVIRLLNQGLNNRQIGERIHLSESTIRHHFTSIYKKLDLPDRLALLVFAYRHGLVE